MLHRLPMGWMSIMGGAAHVFRDMRALYFTLPVGEFCWCKVHKFSLCLFSPTGLFYCFQSHKKKPLPTGNTPTISMFSLQSNSLVLKLQVQELPMGHDLIFGYQVDLIHNNGRADQAMCIKWSNKLLLGGRTLLPITIIATPLCIYKPGSILCLL